MKPRVFTLTNVLSVALAGAVAILVYVVFRDRVGWRPSPSSERLANVKETRTRESKTREIVSRDPAPDGSGGPVATPDVAPDARAGADGVEVTRAATESGGVKKGPDLTHEVQLTASDSAPNLAGGSGPSLWYSADVVPAIAVYLLQFAQSAHWPDGALPEGRGFSIGILRDDNLRGVITSLLLEKSVNGRPISVLGAEHPEALLGCQIVFVSDLVHAEDARGAFAVRPIMTVTYGGSVLNDTWCDIEMIWGARRAGFVVDREALARKRITVDDALLKLEVAFVRNAQGQAASPQERSAPQSGPIPAGGILQ